MELNSEGLVVLQYVFSASNSWGKAQLRCWHICKDTHLKRLSLQPGESHTRQNASFILAYTTQHWVDWNDMDSSWSVIPI